MNNRIGALILALSVLPAASARAQTLREPDASLDGRRALGDRTEDTEREPAPSDEHPVERALFGAFAGLALVGAGSAIGAGVGMAASDPCASDSWFCFHPEYEAGLGALAGGGIALATLYPLGVALGAAAWGGRGDVTGSYLGALIGDAVGVGIFGIGYAISSALGNDPAPNIVAVVIGVGAAMVGPILGYELSDRSARRSPPRPAVSWLPTLRVDSRGGSIGVAGVF